MESRARRQTVRIALAALVLILAVFIGLSPASAATKIFERTLPLQAGRALALSNINGSVQVEGWDRNEVEIRATKTALRNPLDLERVRIDVESDGERATISTIYPQGNGVEVTVDYLIHVPDRILLDGIETVNGDVNILRITGAGELASINGSIEVLDSEGRFSAKTTNGDVRLDLKKLPSGEPMQLATVNGSVVLSLPADAGAELNVVSRNGDFHCDFPLRTLGAYNPRIFRGRLGGGGGGDILLTTVNGAIRVVQGKPVI